MLGRGHTQTGGIHPSAAWACTQPSRLLLGVTFKRFPPCDHVAAHYMNQLAPTRARCRSFPPYLLRRRTTGVGGGVSRGGEGNATAGQPPSGTGCCLPLAVVHGSHGAGCARWAVEAEGSCYNTVHRSAGSMSSVVGCKRRAWASRCWGRAKKQRPPAAILSLLCAPASLCKACMVSLYLGMCSLPTGWE